MEERDKRPLISLCMVVNNNAVHLPLSLSSVRGFVDEIIIMDMGSTDGSQRIAREFDAVVREVPGEKDIPAVRNEALGFSRGKWILQLEPGHELVAKDGEMVRRKLREDGYLGYFIPEYSLSNPDDYYYQPLLFQNLPDLRYRPHFDESPLVSLEAELQSPMGPTASFPGSGGLLGLLTSVSLYHRSRKLREEEIRRKIDQIKKRLKDAPGDIRLYYYLAFFSHEVGREGEYQWAVQEGIQVMTSCPLEKVIQTSEAVGLFGYFAESLIAQNVLIPSSIDSLIKLERSLHSDVRLNRPLAILLHRAGRSKEAIDLLRKTISGAFRPAWSTVSFYQSFVEPIVQLLEMIRQTSDEDTLLRTILGLQVLAAKHNLDIKPVFSYLNQRDPQFFLLIEGALKRKIGEVT